MNDKTEAPAEQPALVIAHAKADARARTFPLQWPLIVNGKTLDAVMLKRLSAKEVEAFVAIIQAQGENELAHWPIFCDPADGSPLPKEVFDALDDDDSVALNKVALDFLPQRFRQGVTDTLSSDLPAGEPTARSRAE